MIYQSLKAKDSSNIVQTVSEGVAKFTNFNLFKIFVETKEMKKGITLNEKIFRLVVAIA